MEKGNFETGRNGRTSVKYRDTLRLSVQKRLNRPRCRLGLESYKNSSDGELGIGEDTAMSGLSLKFKQY